jgi:transcriptional regulator with XRE-family HTH domain
MTPIVELIAKNIKRLREWKKFSQKEVCVGAGLPQGQYSRIENGKVEPSVSTLEKIALIFEVSISEFFRSDDLKEELKLQTLIAQ